MLKLADLAVRPDFCAGSLSISPSRRLVEGPAGAVNVEPLIMQVLLLLIDARGQVVTRNDLFDQCWGGAMVGDDSLNRAIGKVRRIAAETAPGAFEIETIPRTGYRLTGSILDRSSDDFDSVAGARPARGGMTRRVALGGGVALAGAVAAGSWWAMRRGDPRFDALMEQGDEAFRDGTAFEGGSIIANRSRKMVGLYEQAVRLKSDDPRAWGLLAYFRSAKAQGASVEESAAVVASAQSAIHRALELDPTEPNARVAKYLLEGRMLDWTERDRQLRSILTTEPGNLPAMIELMPLLQAAGLTRESWGWNERILEASPLARPFLVVRAIKLWILGRIRESDNVIDRVRSLWPDYGFGYSVRFNLFAMTGRPRAARAMLESAPDSVGGPDEIIVWRAALEALETRTASAIAEARSACRDAARKDPSAVNDLVMILGALGESDAAFEVTDGFLLWRGNIVSADHADGKKVDDYSRRMTQWLFTPPLAQVRQDPRFLKLCEEFGLTAYWRNRGVRPDYMLTV